MFINFSNHPFSKFPKDQMEAVQQYGDLVEVPFPKVSSYASREEVQKLAESCVDQIMEYKPDVVMCQGEFTLTYAVVTRLKARGVTCVSACSERNSVEIVHEDGTVTKESVFNFQQFREY